MKKEKRPDSVQESLEKHFGALRNELRQQPCAPISSAVPSWPSQRNHKAAWFGLHGDFVFSHHPSYTESLGYKRNRTGRSADHENCQANDLFCIPEDEVNRLYSIIRNSRGGSLLVTGYRGTGKSSLVNYAVDRLLADGSGSPGDGANESGEKQNKAYVPIRINLSTSRDAQSLAHMMLKELHRASKLHRFGEASREADSIIEEAYRRSTREETVRAVTRENKEASIGVTRILSLGAKLSHGDESVNENSLKPYSLHEAQSDLVEALRLLSESRYKVIFILDELDKLTPQNAPGDRPYIEKLLELQRIVADLKFLLTEAHAFCIFIAGKNVDDSWQEDQNKGEGLFESAFIQNIYLPSTFTARLKPALGPHVWVREAWKKHYEVFIEKPSKDKDIKKFKETIDNWTEELLDALMRELGIASGSWTHTTGLLVLPHLSMREWMRLLTRVVLKTHARRGFKDRLSLPGKNKCTYDQIEQNKTNNLALNYIVKGAPPDSSLVLGERKESGEAAPSMERGAKLDWLVALLHPIVETARKEQGPGLQEGDDSQSKSHGLRIWVAPERSCRRLRYLLQYLTYKGRGVPRKILREFYSMFRHRSIVPDRADHYWSRQGDLEHIVHLPLSVRQKLKFFADIVSELESHPELFRTLDDKGCVATFHTIDYILKFFKTGFKWADIEYASFMSYRKELFPSRELVETVLSIFEDVLLERVDRRHRTYMLLPQVRHDLRVLYLAFGPEQIELRFTMADFTIEYEYLKDMVERTASSESKQRLESFRAQVRIGEIREDVGDHTRARLEYNKALRWIRMDIERMLANKMLMRSGIGMTAVRSYVSAEVDVLQRLAYLYEQEREFRLASQHLQEAIQVHQDTWALASMDLSDSERSTRSTSRVPSEQRPDEPEGALQGLLTTESLGIDPALRKNGELLKITEGKEHPGCEGLFRVVRSMLPESELVIRKLFPFSWHAGYFSEEASKLAQRPLYSGHDPIGLPHSMNTLAVVFEKMWHRFSANIFLLRTLDFYLRIGDDYGTIDQMILIGEMMVRRRDVRTAAEWYLLAYKRLSSLQWCDSVDESSKLPEYQSRMRAKLFEHMGDLYLATHGTCTLREGEEKAPTEMAIRASMKKFRRTYGAVRIDNRDDEYFYTQASVHYNVNHQPFRACDVYMKKLLIRRDRLLWALERSKGPNGVSQERLGEAVHSWCSFWSGAEKTLNALIDPRPGVRQVQPLELGRIRDRRRFGALYVAIGNMFCLASNRSEILKWYWDTTNSKQKTNKACAAYKKKQLENAGQEPTGYDSEFFSLASTLAMHSDLPGAAMRIDRILALITDNKALLSSDKDETREQVELAAPKGVGLHSPLWNLASTSWRELKKCVCCDSQNIREVTEYSTQGNEEPVLNEAWPNYPNVMLTGHLYYLARCLKARILASSPSGASFMKELDATILSLRTMFRGELSFLGARVMLDDNIRGLNTAEADRGLGVLYLQAIRHALKLRAWFLEQGSPGVGKEKECGWGFEMNLGVVLALLQTASKRFLVQAIDTYRLEEEHLRCTRQQLGTCYHALADLLVVRAETVECSMLVEGKELARTLPGLHKLWPKLSELLHSYTNHNADLIPSDIRRQADEAYRDALRQTLSELEDYSKRYRFPHNAYIQHKNISDRRMHFDICASIRKRHLPTWGDLYEAQQGAPAEKADRFAEEPHRHFESVASLCKDLAMLLFQRYPRVDHRDLWMQDIQRMMRLARDVRPGPSYLMLLEVKGSPTKDNRPKRAEGDDEIEVSAEKFRLVWNTPKEAAKTRASMNRDCFRKDRFFRSLQDELTRPSPR